MKKLISMTDFVSDILDYTHESRSYRRGLLLLQNYLEFIKQPLKLEMFVPCDEEGNVLEEPESSGFESFNDQMIHENYEDEYQAAKEKVLFENCIAEHIKSTNSSYYIVSHNGINIFLSWNTSKVVEDLIGHDLTLTPSAVKKLGL